MIINEKGLARALKLAYKHGGYTLIANGEQIILFTEGWYLRCDKDKFPRKALATIVEHMGTPPTTADALSIADGEEPQVVMPEVAGQDVSSWESGQAEETASMVPFIVWGMQLYQVADGAGPCYGVDPVALAVTERDIAGQAAAAVLGDGRLKWEHDGETVIVGAVRPAGRYWDRPWQQEVWAALEAVDLHRKEA